MIDGRECVENDGDSVEISDEADEVGDSSAIDRGPQPSTRDEWSGAVRAGYDGVADPERLGDRRLGRG
jgi:hypothetical protein